MASGIGFVVAGSLVGALVAPIGFVGVAVGLVDLVLARRFVAAGERA